MNRADDDQTAKGEEETGPNDGAVDPRFLAALEALPTGHSQGFHAGRRWGVTLDVSADGRRRWLYAEALDGTDHVSFNLFRLDTGPALRPCEMATTKVVRFVLAYSPDQG